ncbi:hypothetical protein BG53_15080 [Paenibacillus darwinianus]|uniref:DUF2157 domain-containing protein n=1 Tax=Paenibacillus darwinianus TaxID=1380763 RepID=A0A9W5S492_9BACL|nr:hypothetical protein [Paenibacillus darwinianus]EXX91872.1 hypothetical protein BG52_06085 [Paenibacillus darwinianus]EXX92353.1 hypothetical protein BG53_15080 [Paenibacillus darwinianus]EXX92715.1 hypothetical protein CH50_01940 [Paenibacillus darwinianus]
MNEDRRKTIIREIDYWRRSKLLPEQYCDFLLNLYIDEQVERTPAGFTGKAAAAFGYSSGKHWLLAFGVIPLIYLIYLYFNAFHPALQTGLALTAVLGLLVFGQRYRTKSEAAGLAYIVLGMFFLLGIGLYLLSLNGLEGWGASSLFLTLCGLLWIIFGTAARIPILHFCGWAALILVYAVLLIKSAIGTEWYQVQLYWVPGAFVFGWFSWFVHRWSKPASAVLFITAVLLWFMPEVHSAFLVDGRSWILLQLIVKMALGGAILFAIRKQVIAWVA